MSYIAFATDRFDELTAFYHTLGFPVIAQWDRTNGRGQRFDLGGGLRLEILDNARERHPAPVELSQHVQIVIEVQDIQAAWQDLTIVAPPPQSSSWGASLFQIRDPDGVPITFLEWNKARSELT